MFVIVMVIVTPVAQNAMAMERRMEFLLISGR